MNDCLQNMEWELCWTRKTIPHPTFVSSLESRNFWSLNLPCQPQILLSLSWRMLWAGSSWGRSILIKFLSALCTWTVPKENIWTIYFLPFSSPPFTMLGIYLGHFKTGLLISITFQVITNSTEPDPKLLSRWKIAEVQRQYPNWCSVSKWKKSWTLLSNCILPKAVLFLTGFCTKYFHKWKWVAPSTAFTHRVWEGNIEATKHSLKTALKQHGITSTSLQ